MTAQKPQLLFVYGTLRSGSDHPMARLLARHARRVGPARMAGRLFDLGRYPGMTDPASPDEWVHGEVFELFEPDKILPELDRYEGCAPGTDPPLFQRQRREAQFDDGKVRTAWVYLYCATPEGTWRVPSGDYYDRR